MKRISPALVLFFLAPAAGELLSGSAPPVEFFNPFMLIVLTALYGSGVEPASKDWDAALGALRAARKSCRARRRGGRESLPPLNPRVLERS